MKVKSVGKRFLAMLLTASMLVGMVPTTMFAADTVADSADSLNAALELESKTATNVGYIEEYARQLQQKNTLEGLKTVVDNKNIDTDDWTDADYFRGGYFTWDTEGNKGDSWRYYNGVMLDALLMMDKNTYDGYAKTIYDSIISEVDDYTTIHNAIDGYGTKKKGNVELDSIEMARPLFDLIDGEVGNETYELAIQYTYQQLTEERQQLDSSTDVACGGNFWHKYAAPNSESSWLTYKVGLDGLYMAQPFLMETANAVNDKRLDASFKTMTYDDNDSAKAVETGTYTIVPATIYKEVYERMMWVADTMYDEETKLYHHGWNPNNEVNAGNGHFWLRGIGWYAAALVDVIELMPGEGNSNATDETKKYKEDLIGNLSKLFDGMMKYQDATGMWYNVVNRDATLTAGNGNQLETSGTALMAYAMMKAYNNGWVGDKYGEAGLKAFNGIVDSNDHVSGKGTEDMAVKGIYKSASVFDTDDAYCTNEYKTDEAKGTGPLIMAATLAEETASNLAGWVTVETVVEPDVYTPITEIVANDSINHEFVITSRDLPSDGTKPSLVLTSTNDIFGFGEETITCTKIDGTDRSYYLTEVDGATALSQDHIWKYYNGILSASNGSDVRYLNLVDRVASITDDKGAQNTIWNIGIKPTDLNKHVIYYSVENESNYDCFYYNTVFTTQKEVGSDSLYTKNTLVWERTPGETICKQVALTGTTEFKATVGDELADLKSEIMSAAAVYSREDIGSSDTVNLNWDENQVSVGWDAIDMSVAGTYYVPVSYIKTSEAAVALASTTDENTIPLGTITVTVEEAPVEDDTTTGGDTTDENLKWQQIAVGQSPDIYTPVGKELTLDDDGDYVITERDRPKEENPLKQSMVLAKNAEGAYIIGEQTVHIIKAKEEDINRLTIDSTDSDGGCYYIYEKDGKTPLTAENIWNMWNKILSVSDGTNKRWLNVRNDNWVLDSTDQKSNSTRWNITTKSNGEWVYDRLVVSVGEKGIRYDNGFVWTSKQDTYNLLVWKKHSGVTIYDQVALAGNTIYNVSKGDSSTIDIIKDNTRIMYFADGATEAVQVDWNNSENDSLPGKIVIEEGWDSIDVNKLGTHTVNVSYVGETGEKVSLGTITVNVEGKKWVDIDNVVTQNDKYTLVRTMKEDSNGYVIAVRGAEVGELRTLGWMLNGEQPVYNNNTVLMVEATDIEYKDDLEEGATYLFRGVSDTNLWYMEDLQKVKETVEYKDGSTADLDAVQGLIYTIGADGKPYYLQVKNDANGTVAMTRPKEDASTWVVVKTDRDRTTSYIRATNSEGEEVALKGDSTKFNISGRTNAVEIWERTPGATNKTGQVALDGKLEYSVAIGDSEDAILKKVTAETYISYRQDSASTTYDKILLDDPNVTYEWVNGFNTTSAGALSLLVKYAGVEIGTVTVNVAESKWTTIEAKPLYKKVTTMEPNTEYGYVIVSETSTLALSWQGETGINSVALDVEIQPYDGKGLYTIKGANKFNHWFYNESGNIFAYNNYLNHSQGIKYYLKGEQTTKENGNSIVIYGTEPDTATAWTVQKQSDDTPDRVIVKHGDNYLRGVVYQGDPVFYLINSNWHVYLYQQTSETTVGGSATLSGTTEHSVRQGDTSFTEVSAKEAATILYKEDGNDYADFVNWDDGNVKCSWTKTGASGVTEDVSRFSTTEAGTYTMTVTYLEVPIGEITVVVEEAVVSGDPVWTLPTNNTITTGLGSEPDFSDIKLTINYTDGESDEITVKDGLLIKSVDEYFDINEPGTYEFTVSYGEYSRTITVIVDEDPYYGLDEVTGSKLPNYPEEGAVRVKKDAYDNNKEFTFKTTGVTQVELDVAGISSKSGVDVVLVVDVSNSMGWTDDWSDARKDYYEAENVTEDKAKDWFKIAGVDDYLKNIRPKTVADFGDKTSIETVIDGTTAEGDKLDAAMAAATTFAEKLLGTNEEGSYKNNSLSFVTFAGYDAQNNNKGTTEYIDAVQTVFTNVESYQDAKEVFDATKFTKYTITDTIDKDSVSTKVKYELAIGNLDGTVDAGQNRGNTNYDYAFSEAQKAVDAVQAKYGNSYDELGRHTIVLFMTDGAATHYNDEHADGDETDRIYGYNIAYPAEGSYLSNGYDYPSYTETTTDEVVTKEYKNDKENWTVFLNKTNKYAQKLDASVEAFYAVGFDLSHGGFSDFSWASDTDVKTLENVLTNMAGYNYSGKPNIEGVQLVDKEEELKTFFEDLANQLQMPGEQAQVEDMIHSDYSLQIGSVWEADNEFNLTKIDGFMPSIEVKSYKLYTSADGDPGKIGQRKPETETDSEGNVINNVTPIETVTFKEVTETVDGKEQVVNIEAYSNLKKDDNGNPINILTLKENDDGTLAIDEEGRFIPERIEAEYFTYENVEDVDGDGDIDEMFYWRLGNITEEELALTYHAYLEEALYKDAPAEDYDDYDTNEYADLHYIDVDGNHAIREFPVPDRSWGSAKTEVEFYLVDKNGTPINLDTNEEVTFDTRYKIDVSEEYQDYLVKTFLWSGEPITVTAAELAAYLPSGYTMYNPNASYTVTVNENDSGSFSFEHGDEAVNKYGEQSTERFDTNQSDLGHTKVAFAVTLVEQMVVTRKLGIDRVVLDYGKPITVDVFKNNPDIAADPNISAKVVGFVEYNSDPDFINLTQGNRGTETYPDDNGIFSITEDGLVKYTPTKMLTEVEKVFTVAEVDMGTGLRTYIMYQELEIIPATNVYYETDFADDIFTMTQAEGASAWTTVTDSTQQSDSTQDDGLVNRTDVTSGDIVADQTYGYDSSYDNDLQLSNGSSEFVLGQGIRKTKATFSFTGTGFDLISRTGEKQGAIRVDIYRDEACTDLAKSVTVLNKSESKLELYQVPVVTVDNLEHGTYYVVIGVNRAISEQSIEALNRGAEFHFDAIRVYNPVNPDKVAAVNIESLDVGASTIENAETGEVTEYSTEQIAALVYNGHLEAYPRISEVREALISEESYGYEETTGITFIDRGVDVNGNIVEAGGNHNVEVSTYSTIGPNNEVYLGKGQAIAFKITATGLTSVDIGAKSADGNQAQMQTIISSTTYSDTLEGNAFNKLLKDVTSSTEQYFDLMEISTINGAESGNASSLSSVLTNGNSAYVVITNTGEGILSITDIKLAYDSETESQKVPSFTVDENVLNFAREYLPIQ